MEGRECFCCELRKCELRKDRRVSMAVSMIEQIYRATADNSDYMLSDPAMSCSSGCVWLHGSRPMCHVIGIDFRRLAWPVRPKLSETTGRTVHLNASTRYCISLIDQHLQVCHYCRLGAPSLRASIRCRTQVRACRTSW